MKVKDLIAQEVCIDVYDNVCEELGIAFDGPLVLTDAGMQKFSEVLYYEVSLVNSGPYMNAIVDVDGPEGVWQKRLRKAKRFFDAAAGYCTVEEYEAWFAEA